MSVHHEYMIIFNIIILAGLIVAAILFSIYNSKRYVEVFYDKPTKDKKTLLRYYKTWFVVSCIVNVIFIIVFAYQIQELRLLGIL